MTPAVYPDRSRRAVTVELALASMGAGLLLVAGLARQPWLDRHFLPSFFVTRPTYVGLETAARLLLAASGLGLVLARARLGGVLSRSPGRVAQLAIAVACGLAAAELSLRALQLRPGEWLGRDREPRRQADARLGWIFVPSRTVRSAIGGRIVEYTFDAAGCRVERPDAPVDPARPTALFIGESVMFGKGLTWAESIPAQAGALSGVQSANLAVDGYGTDQAYWRLEAALPRFRQPVAVVTIFMTTLFGRNLDDDRPHAGPGLTWTAGVHHGRLRSLVQVAAPYRSAETVARGVAVTRDVLRATAALAQSRGARTLVLVPQFGPEDGVEASLRHRILDEAGVPYVLVWLDPAWRLPGDGHPDAHAARVMAEAVADRLRTTIAAR